MWKADNKARATQKRDAAFANSERGKRILKPWRAELDAVKRRKSQNQTVRMRMDILKVVVASSPIRNFTGERISKRSTTALMMSTHVSSFSRQALKKLTHCLQKLEGKQHLRLSSSISVELIHFLVHQKVSHPINFQQ